MNHLKDSPKQAYYCNLDFDSTIYYNPRLYNSVRQQRLEQVTIEDIVWASREEVSLKDALQLIRL